MARYCWILLSALLIGCTATSANKYYEALESESTIVLASFSDVVALPDVPMLLTPEEEGALHKIYKLDERDRMYAFAEYKSHFKVF